MRANNHFTVSAVFVRVCVCVRVCVRECLVDVVVFSLRLFAQTSNILITISYYPSILFCTVKQIVLVLTNIHFILLWK